MVFLTCPTCGGRGYVQGQLCTRCGGFGEVLGPPKLAPVRPAERKRVKTYLRRSTSLH